MMASFLDLVLVAPGMSVNDDDSSIVVGLLLLAVVIDLSFSSSS